MEFSNEISVNFDLAKVTSVHSVPSKYAIWRSVSVNWLMIIFVPRKEIFLRYE